MHGRATTSQSHGKKRVKRLKSCQILSSKIKNLACGPVRHAARGQNAQTRLLNLLWKTGETLTSFQTVIENVFWLTRLTLIELEVTGNITFLPDFCRAIFRTSIPSAVWKRLWCFPFRVTDHPGCVEK